MSATPSQPHPYESFEGTSEWAALDHAIHELAANHDLVETTGHGYIVGYLCKALETSGKRFAGTTPRTTAMLAMREAVLKANPEKRDLAQELIEDRRQEMARE